jgi:hypothetical protein
MTSAMAMNSRFIILMSHNKLIATTGTLGTGLNFNRTFSNPLISVWTGLTKKKNSYKFM